MYSSAWTSPALSQLTHDRAECLTKITTLANVIQDGSRTCYIEANKAKFQQKRAHYLSGKLLEAETKLLKAQTRAAEENEMRFRQGVETGMMSAEDINVYVKPPSVDENENMIHRFMKLLCTHR